MKLLSDPAVTAIVVEHRDRLMRFGAEIEVLTSFCARLHGRRSARNKARKAVDAITSDA